MAIYRFKQLTPTIHPDTFIFESADIIGDVILEAGASVWGQASIRADNARISIGRNSNIQEGCVLHVDPGIPITVGNNVTVGHQAMLHGCTIGDGSLIGIQAIVLNNARIGRNCLIGAGALIPEGKEIPDNSLVIGIGKIVRQLSEEEIAGIHQGNQHYVEKTRQYRAELEKIG